MNAREQARFDARQKLLRAFVDLGYPEEFGVVVADNLRSEKLMARMTSYLCGVKPSSMEEIADEMLALLADRDRWVEKKASEYYNAKITEFYNRDRSDSQDQID